MGREDWYRNTDWDADTETAFRSKLARSRSGRPQYLIIQAGYLAERHPSAALALIDEYFVTGDNLHVPGALCVRAAAYQALEKVDEAVASYKEALEWESGHPGLVSTARIDFPRLVAEHRLRNEYDRALEVLAALFSASDHQFPSIRYVWNGSNALIAHDLGHLAEAREFAERALNAASEIGSPFRYHRDVGVVQNASDDFGIRLKRIARPSKLRSMFRLLSKS